MTELLVVFACIEGSGCAESSRAYYEGSPTLQEVVARGQDYGRKVVGQTAFTYVAPVLSLGAGMNATIKTGESHSVTIKPREGFILWNKEI